MGPGGCVFFFASEPHRIRGQGQHPTAHREIYLAAEDLDASEAVEHC